MHNNTSDVLPLADGLRVLYHLANGQFGNQETWFARLFWTYHAARSDDLGIDYMTAQATISRLLNGVFPFPRRMYAHYTSQQGDASLRCDIARYLDDAIGSARQREIYISQIEALVRSSKLNSQDREYILRYNADCTATEQPTELLYRMLRILIREPILKAA